MDGGRCGGKGAKKGISNKNIKDRKFLDFSEFLIIKIFF
jgi:hypothetical protein